MKNKIIISGMHCKACKLLIETEISNLNGVKKIDVDFSNSFANIEYDENKISENDIKNNIEKLNYKVEKFEIENKSKNINIIKNTDPKIFTLILLGLTIFIFLIYIINKFELFSLLSKLNEKNLSLGLIFIIGLITGVHCIGMCGGFVMSYSVSNNEKSRKENFISHLQYNIGRIISYSIVGGILGLIGSVFFINPLFISIITIFAALLMLTMGISFILEKPFFKNINLNLSNSIGKLLYSNKYTKKIKLPFIIGILNAFVPCGPLQAMQLYAISSGSLINGALSMGVFALGTAPLMFGFGTFVSKLTSKRASLLIRISGVIIFILGSFMFFRGLNNLGSINNNIIKSENNSGFNITMEDGKQVVKMDLTYSGYSPNTLKIKKGIPVKWIINGIQVTGCTNEIILHGDFNIKKPIKKGENIIEFTPTESGEIPFSCWMKMVWGKFIVE